MKVVIPFVCVAVSVAVGFLFGCLLCLSLGAASCEANAEPLHSQLANEWQRLSVEPMASNHSGVWEGYLRFTFYGDGQGSHTVYLHASNTIAIPQQITESLEWLEREAERLPK